MAPCFAGRPRPRSFGASDRWDTPPKPHTSHFTNRYGEEWEFEYDTTRGEGILRGSDVDRQEYRVIEGQVAGLVLSDEEIRWLRKTWMEATSGD